MESDIVVLLTLFVVSVIIGIELLIIRRFSQLRKKNKTAVETSLTGKGEEADEECPRFGYLAEHPQGEPVPDDCFGCRLALKCMSNDSIRFTERAASAEEIK